MRTAQPEEEIISNLIETIVDENGALTAKELAERMGRTNINFRCKIADIMKSRKETFKYLGQYVGWTLTDKKWDKLDGETNGTE